MKNKDFKLIYDRLLYDNEFEIQDVISAHYEQSTNAKRKTTTLKRSRAGYASAITRKLHTLENLMLDDTEFEQVATSIEGIHSSFATTHDELMLNLAYDWEEAEKARELYRKVEAQMKDLYHMIEARKADSELVRLGESASSSLSGQTSHTAHSSQSRRSTTSSRLMKAKAEQTKELKLKQLQQQQIDCERDELRQQAELRKAEYEIEEARINAQLEEELETRSCKSKSQNSTSHEPLRPVSSSQDTTYHELPHSDPLASNSYTQHKHELISVNCDNTNKSIQPVKYMSQHHETESQGFSQKTQCDRSKPASQSECPPPSKTTLNPTANEWIPTTSSEPTIQSQEKSRDDAVNMYVAMVSAVRENFMMPKPEILTFNGDPVTHYKFIRCFETNIQDRISDSSLRLSYLIQYCTGEAKESIEDCVIQEPTEGHQRARKILEKRYGRPHIIARAHIQKLIECPVLKPNDHKALSQLSMQMDRCLLTLEQMGYEADLNNCDNLLKIVRRLPLHLRSKWVDRADMIIESGIEPSFSDLVNFIEKSARPSENMYGQDFVHSNTAGDKSKMNKNPMPKQKVTAFATTSDSKKANVQTQTSNKSEQKHSENRKQRCHKCQNEHQLIDCPEFKASSYIDRKAFTRDHGLCDNCFLKGHLSKRCYRDRSCTVKDCNVQWKHHTLLHPQEAEDTANVSSYRTQLKEPSDNGTGRVFLKIVPVDSNRQMN